MEGGEGGWLQLHIISVEIIHDTLEGVHGCVEVRQKCASIPYPFIIFKLLVRYMIHDTLYMSGYVGREVDNRLNSHF